MKPVKIALVVFVGILLSLCFQFNTELEIGKLTQFVFEQQSKKQKPEIKYITTEEIEVATDEWKSSSPVCLEAQNRDGDSFGSSVAINDKYLAIGDYESNKVIIYERDKNGDWHRKKEIKPPENSVLNKIGFGFGSDLALDGENLIVVANVVQDNKDVNHPEYYQFKDISRSYFKGIYKGNLKNNVAKRIDRETIAEEIALDEGKIAFSTTKDSMLGKKTRQVILLDKNQQVSLPKYRHRIQIGDFVPSKIALKDNYLAIANQLSTSNGHILLFDLNARKKKPQKLYLPNIQNYRKIAISDEFVVATGENYELKYYESKPYVEIFKSGTVIHNIHNGKTIIINNLKPIGGIFLNNDIWIRGIFLNDNVLGIETNIRTMNQLKYFFNLYRLDNASKPYLLRSITGIQKPNFHHSFSYQNDFLVTSIRGKSVCLEQFS